MNTAGKNMLASDLVRIGLAQVAWGVVLFGAAGRLDLPWFWAVILIQLLTLAVAVPRIDPALRRERLRPGPGGQDRALRFVSIPFLVGQLVVAGLDAGRFHWSEMPLAGHVLGLAGFALGLGLAMWAMVTNPFFSPVVRVQEERGHRLITGGPYRYVRHPGYAGTLLCTLSISLALGSWYAVLAIVPWWGLLLRRTLIEDRFLRRELPGYAEYAGRVRHRWLPGMW